MERIQSKEALLKLRDTFKENLRVREQGEQIEKLITIKVFMGSSGYKSGAKEILNHIFIDGLSGMALGYTTGKKNSPVW